jgi:hypothetical protein
MITNAVGGQGSGQGRIEQVTGLAGAAFRP